MKAPQPMAPPPARDPVPTQSALASRPEAAARPPVSLHVERLVLQGLSLAPHEGARVQKAFEAELALGLGAGALPTTGLSALSLDRLRIQELRVAPGSQPEQIGRALASALLRGLRP